MAVEPHEKMRSELLRKELKGVKVVDGNVERMVLRGNGQMRLSVQR